MPGKSREFRRDFRKKTFFFVFFSEKTSKAIDIELFFRYNIEKCSIKSNCFSMGLYIGLIRTTTLSQS